MADGWSYFKAVYGTVPTWITAMHEHNPCMLKHVKGMVAAGASMAEFIEYFWVAYCYQDDQALLMSTQALALALQLRGQTVPPDLLLAQDVEAVLAQYQALTEPAQLNHLNRIIASQWLTRARAAGGEQWRIGRLGFCVLAHRGHTRLV